MRLFHNPRFVRVTYLFEYSLTSTFNHIVLALDQSMVRAAAFGLGDFGRAAHSGTTSAVKGDTCQPPRSGVLVLSLCIVHLGCQWLHATPSDTLFWPWISPWYVLRHLAWVILVEPPTQEQLQP